MLPHQVAIVEILYTIHAVGIGNLESFLLQSVPTDDK